jgi:hypothetical protein
VNIALIKGLVLFEGLVDGTTLRPSIRVFVPILNSCFVTRNLVLPNLGYLVIVAVVVAVVVVVVVGLACCATRFRFGGFSGFRGSLETKSSAKEPGASRAQWISCN